MINHYQALVEYCGEDWESFLDDILLSDIFKPLIDAYPDKNNLKCVIRYIVYSYSVDSDKIGIGVDWENNKKKIFEFVCVKPQSDLFNQLVNLTHPKVIEVIHNWLNHQGGEVFSRLQSLKDLKVEMQQASNGMILKSTGERDYDQKFKNAGYVKELSQMIKDLEAEIIQNNPKLKDAIRELDKLSGTKNSRSIGSYAVS